MRQGYIFKKVDCPSCIAASEKLTEIKLIPNIEWKEIILPGTATDQALVQQFNISYVPTVIIQDGSNVSKFGFNEIMNNAAQIISGKNTTVNPDTGPDPVTVPVPKKDNKLIWIAAAVAAIIILND